MKRFISEKENRMLSSKHAAKSIVCYNLRTEA